MAGRPQKHTVEYFTHDADASQKRTLSILFNHFGHEGISAWWQLLERISLTNNHIIDTRNTEDYEYLASKMRFAPERLKIILQKLAELDAIDAELFRHGLIWSQNFVDRLGSVYKTRHQPLPSKPELSGKEKPFIVEEKPLIVPEYTQSRVEKSREENTKETKAKKEKITATTEADLLEFVEETKSQYPDLDCEVEFRKFQTYWSECGRKLKLPKTAWLNWLTKARQISAENDALAQARRASARGNERLTGGEIGGNDGKRKGVRPRPDQERKRPITYVSGSGLPEDNP